MTLRLIPYLVLNGTTADAIKFYEDTFGAKLLFSQSFGDMPANPEFQLPEEAKSLIGHATVQIGESTLMLSDTFPGQPHVNGNQVTICVSIKDIEQAKQIFNALAQEGQVGMPFQDTHFSPGYGQVTDKFGITFQIFTEGSM